MEESAGTPPHRREPFLRAPWPAVTLAASFVLVYALQAISGDPAGFGARFGFAPAALAAGEWRGLVTALFVHGGWTHAILNALGALAFGAPVARLLGPRPAGVVGFFALFLICGVVASLGFAAVHPDASAVLIGASGGVSGYMAAASRLIDARGGLAPFTSRSVVAMAGAWVVVNLMVALVGLEAVSGGAPIAWEAHLAGYACGLVLIGPFARLTRGRGGRAHQAVND